MFWPQLPKNTIPNCQKQKHTEYIVFCISNGYHERKTKIVTSRAEECNAWYKGLAEYNPTALFLFTGNYFQQVIFRKPRCPQVPLDTFVTFLAIAWNGVVLLSCIVLSAGLSTDRSTVKSKLAYLKFKY